MPMLPPALYAAVIALVAACCPAAAQGDDTLRKVVIVSRHGVRAPTAAPAVLANWAAQPWPAWNQPLASLTPRGAQLAVLMGRYYRRYFAAQGAFSAAGCPSPESVYVYADVAERTKATAQSLIDGFAPGCGIGYRTAGDVKVDAAFHPLDAGVCRLDPMLAQTRVLERAGGDLTRFTAGMKASIDTLQSVLECCRPALCTAFGRGEQCALGDLPTALVPHAEASGLSLIGALAIASTASELLLLEYADGLPQADVGWGRATPARMQETWRLHTAQYDLMERTPYLAQRMGSALLAKLMEAVTGSRHPGAKPIDPEAREAKLVAFVGHDTNIWNLAGLMDVSWLQPGFQRNQTPPAGALMFEVREGADRKLRVHAYYVAQSLEQMRSAAELTLDAPPAKTPLRLPGCGAGAPGHACTVEEFATAMEKAIDRDCVD